MKKLIGNDLRVRMLGRCTALAATFNQRSELHGLAKMNSSTFSSQKNQEKIKWITNNASLLRSFDVSVET
jgi:hypothetical protein